MPLMSQQAGTPGGPISAETPARRGGSLARGSERRLSVRVQQRRECRPQVERSRAREMQQLVGGGSVGRVALRPTEYSSTALLKVTTECCKEIWGKMEAQKVTDRYTGRDEAAYIRRIGIHSKFDSSVHLRTAVVQCRLKNVKTRLHLGCYIPQAA